MPQSSRALLTTQPFASGRPDALLQARTPSLAYFVLGPGGEWEGLREKGVGQRVFVVTVKNFFFITVSLTFQKNNLV
jgi:hypothetical protein